jgi:tetratricopeptide (TPR) repeat protein
MKKALYDAYRLRPDRRFLGALVDIDRILSGSAGENQVEATYNNGRWDLTYRERKLGSVPEFPDFKHSLDVLIQFAQETARQNAIRWDSSASHVLEDTTLRELDVLGLLTAARNIDAAWNKGRRSSRRLEDLSRVFSTLAVLLLDRMEIADSFFARAWAIHAMSRAFSAAPGIREEALLAEALGYARHAENLARELPGSDPLRLFLLREDDALRQMAYENDAPKENRFFYLLRLGRMGGVDAWGQATHELLPDPSYAFFLVRTGLELDEFSVNRSLPHMLPMALQLSMSDIEPPSPGMTTEVPEGLSVAMDASAIATFERDIAKNQPLYAGPFLSESLYADYYRGLLFSGLHVLGLFYIDSLASVPAAQEYLESLGEPETELLADFKCWYDHIVGARAGESHVNLLVEDIMLPGPFGGEVRFRSRRELGWAGLDNRDTRLMAGSRGLVVNLDSRLSHRAILQDVARYRLRDLRIEENVMAALVAHSSSFNFEKRIELAVFEGDQDTLLSLLEAERVPAATKADILGHLASLGMDDARLRLRYERLVQENSREWDVVRRYMEHLEEAEEYVSAQAVVDRWLQQADGSEGFDFIGANNAVARLFFKQGLYERGLESVERVVSSYQEGSLGWATRLLTRLGRMDEALEMGQKAVERYPSGIWSRTNLAEVYWRSGDYDEAARVIVEKPNRLDSSDLGSYVGPRFREVFSDKPHETILSAFEAFKAAGLKNWQLLNFGRAFWWEDDYEPAFLLENAIPLTERDNQFEYNLERYMILRDWKGKPEAIEWLRERTTQADNFNNVQALTRSGELDLLWDLVVDLSEVRDPHQVWISRAAAHLWKDVPDEGHKTALLRYYRETESPHIKHYLGRHMMGLIPEEELIQYTRDRFRRAALTYYLAIKAVSEGRYVDASDWLRISAETEVNEVNERIWSMELLRRWSSKRKSLSRFTHEDAAKHLER